MASHSSLGGAASDAGSEYQRSVAAYIAAHALTGHPLAGFSGGSKKVGSVAAETDAWVDDLRIDFTDGTTAYVQAKRRLRNDSVLRSALSQWGDAAHAGLSASTDSLVVVSGSISGPVSTLRQELERYKLDSRSAPTASQQKAISDLRGALKVSEAEFETVLRCGYIHELDAEGHTTHGAREAKTLLRGIVDDPDGAWRELVNIGGVLARRRGGLTVEGLVRHLTQAGHAVTENGGSPAAGGQRRVQTLARHVQRLQAAAANFDLRHIGADIRPIPRADAHADVVVHTGDDRSGYELAWLTVRLGRLLVTGLPGSGKSSMLRETASRLTTLPYVGTPFMASLRTMYADTTPRTFTERLVTAALADTPPHDFDEMNTAFREKLRGGGVVLLLDGLDETYERKRQVVSDLDDFLSSASPDIDVVLSTRHVAYAQAQTLGWPEVTLGSPRGADRCVRAILQAHVDQSSAKVSDPVGWIDMRARWVSDAQERLPALRETPLMVCLLAVLAATKDPCRLPDTRAAVLNEMVSLVVGRHELTKSTRLTTATQSSTAAHDRALDAFATEARTLLANPTGATLDNVVVHVASMLRQRWDLVAGLADATARELTYFWDECGIFIIDHHSELVTPRISLMAEVGDAHLAVNSLEEEALRQWTVDRIDRDQHEPVLLAAAQSVVVADALARAACERDDPELARLACRAVREGVNLPSEWIGPLKRVLVADGVRGDAEGWSSVRDLFGNLPLDAADRCLVDQVVLALDAAYAEVVAAQFDLRLRSAEQLRADPDILLSVLRRDKWKALPRRNSADADVDDYWSGREPFIAQVRDEAAQILIGHVAAAAEAAAAAYELARRHHSQSNIRSLLVEHGYGDRLGPDPADEAYARIRRTLRSLPRYDESGPRRLLAHLAQLAEPVDLSYAQAARTDELSDFLETLRMNEGGAHHLHDHPNTLHILVEVVSTLGGFDRQLIAAQAGIAAERMDVDPHSGYYTLFAHAHKREIDVAKWPQVANWTQVIAHVIVLFRLGYGHAYLAARTLWDAQGRVQDLAAPLLRSTVDTLPRNSHRHFEMAAMTLASLSEQPELENWLEIDDPDLRSVAARLLNADSPENPYLTELLNDPDGYVRLAALETLNRQPAAVAQPALQRVATSTDPGWRCRQCHEVNSPGRGVCVTRDCRAGAPRPAEAAAKLLAGEHVDLQTVSFVFGHAWDD